MPFAIERAPSVMRSIGVVMVLESRKESRMAASRPNIIACMTIWKNRQDMSDTSRLSSAMYTI